MGRVTTRWVRRRGHTDGRFPNWEGVSHEYMGDARLSKYITTTELAGGWWWLSATTNFFDVPSPLTSSSPSLFSLLFRRG